ncbi:GAF domain-containing protein [Pleurocapsales cyanobacterium LEGE 10410]|nr:GAF domain-containing protein [Pleurocapsales cyanobacterium LEGE 10410]
MGQQQPDRPNNSTTDNLLQAAADCASTLLSDENFERGVNRALEILGKSADADRLAIAEQHDDLTSQTLGYVVVQYEWLSPNASSQLHHPELNRVSCDTFTEEHYQLLLGKHWGGLIESFPEAFRSGQEKIEVKATYSIPITVEGRYWGILGLDFCRLARELSEAEIAVLKTAATCIGSVIQRERDRQTKESAERNFLLEREKAAQQKAVQLEEHNRVLEKRDRILAATAEASNVLLTGADFDEAVNRALQIIGESIDTDRIAIVENFDNPSNLSYLYWKITYEWDSPDTISQMNHPEVAQGSYEGIEEWYEIFTKGQTISCQLEELPEPFRSKMAKIGLKTIHTVPIFIEGKYWGNVGIDDCREATHRSEAELSILKTAAACIGGAIERERTRRAKEQADRNILLEREKAAQQRAIELAEYNRVLEQRDKILAATAEASNVLLTGADFDKAVNTALKIIGETIDTDRVAVIENWHNPSQPSIPYWKILYEWNSAYAISQSAHSEVSQGSWEGIEEWYKLLSEGQSISCRIEEMPEPFRSGQAKLDVKVLYEVPIFVEGEYWGATGFDDCREATHRSEAELSILKTAAACIGGAIERERTRRAKEQADRNVLLERERSAQERAKLLQAVATVANSLLRSPDYKTALPEVLQILGEAAQSDRCSLVQNVPDPVTGEAAVKIFAEWCREGIRASVDCTPELETALLWSDFPQFQDKLTQGEVYSFSIDELDEPAKSILQAQGNVSMTSVPIMVQGEFWGVFSFDYCREARVFAETDTAVFAIAVDSISAAIEREKQDEALKASEKRYRTLFELSNEGIYRFEFDEPIPVSLPIEERLELGYRNNRIVIANQVFAQQYGFESLEEVIGNKVNDFYISNSEVNREINRKIISDEFRIYNAETEEIDRLGNRRYLLGNVVTEVEDGYIIGGWGTQTDITELKRAQQALLEAERQRVAQLEKSNQVLSLRDRWLEATANAANRLLATPDLDAGINAALKMLGESLDCDRVCILQNFEDNTGETLGFLRLIYEWDSPYASCQISQTEWLEFPWEELKDWLSKEKIKDWAGGIIEELPEPFRSGQIELGVKSLYNVPIFVNGNYWGTFGIDFCREARRLTPPEIAVFKTAASCVGSAIYRQQIQQQREEAETTIILEREQAAQEKAAELTKVNAVLSRSLGKLTDTADLDEFLGEVVLEITRQVGAVCGHIFLYDADNHTLQQRLTVRHGRIYQGAAEHDPTLFHSPFAADITPGFQYMLETGEIVSLNTTDTSELFWDGTIEWHRRMGHQEAAAVALMIGDKPLGMLGLAFDHKSALKPEELELIYALTNQASLAIQLTNLAEAAKKSALIAERTRMAREIHDTLAQAFGGILMQLQVAEYFFNSKPEKVRSHINTACILAQDALAEARRTVWFLYQDDLQYQDLATLIPKVAQHLTADTGVEIEVTILGEAYPLKASLGMNLLRIVQEAIANTLKHANASKIAIKLTYEPQQLSLQVRDNGTGFDTSQQSLGFGLMGMQQRAKNLGGQLTVSSILGEGTKIALVVEVGSRE